MDNDLAIEIEPHAMQEMAYKNDPDVIGIIMDLAVRCYIEGVADCDEKIAASLDMDVTTWEIYKISVEDYFQIHNGHWYPLDTWCRPCEWCMQ